MSWTGPLVIVSLACVFALALYAWRWLTNRWEARRLEKRAREWIAATAPPPQVVLRPRPYDYEREIEASNRTASDLAALCATEELSQ